MDGRTCALVLFATAVVACSDDGSRPGAPWAGTEAASADTGADTSSTTGQQDPSTTTSSSGGDDQASSSDSSTDPGSSSDSGDVPFDLGDVIWLHDDVSGWPETVTLTDVTFEGDSICLNHDISDAQPAWPIVALDADTDVVANPWVFILHDGAWYGATWEWLRPDQTCKSADAVAGDHIKQDPFGENSGWTAISGDRYYFMVSGLARIDGIDNVEERSNIVEVIWP